MKIQPPNKFWLGEGLEDEIEFLLKQRGIDEPKKFLEHSFGQTSTWHNFRSIVGAIPAIVEMEKWIDKPIKVYIEIDPDCDGFCSSAILYQSLRDNTPWEITYNIKNSKVHGLVLDNIQKSSYTLIFVPDAGSNDLNVFEYFSQHPEKRLVVLDHHMIEDEENVRRTLPRNVFLLNSYQQYPPYPNRALSGAGMAFRFCQELFGEKTSCYADLAAIGVIGDVMVLKDLETQSLLAKGIGSGKLHNEFFRLLLDKAAFKTGGRISPFSIAFYGVPFVNAVSRVGTQEERNILFEGMIDGFGLVPSTKRGAKGQTETKAEQACRMCTNVKNRQKKLRDEGVEKIERIIEEKDLLKNKILTVKATGMLDKSLTGLVANQLAAKYQRPVLLLSENEEGFLTGSGRNASFTGIEDLKDYLSDTEYFDFLAGHQSAFGASLPKENLESFTTLTNESLQHQSSEIVLPVDFEVTERELSEGFVRKLASHDFLWGKGIEEPIVAIHKVFVDDRNLTLMSADKNPTLKIMVNKVSAIQFGSSVEQYEELLEQSPFTCALICTCALNTWQGRTSGQLYIQHLINVEPAKIAGMGF